MDDSDREELINYVLGRLSPVASEALERRVCVDSELKRALAVLREELARRSATNVAARAARGFARQNSDVSSDEAGKRAASVSSPVGKRRLRFIPKRVLAPRREDRSLVFKRAAILTDADIAARRARSSSATNRAWRSILSLQAATYSLSAVCARDQLYLAASSPRFESELPSICSNVADEVDSNYFRAIAPELHEESFSVFSVPQRFDQAPVGVASSNASVWTFAEVTRIAIGDVGVAASFDERGAPLFSIAVDEDGDRAASYAVAPIERISGCVVPVLFPDSEQNVASGVPMARNAWESVRNVESSSSIGEMERYKFDALETAEPKEENASSQVCPRTKEEVLEEIASIFGQNARILQQPSGVSLSVQDDEGDSKETRGPTLVAEDRRLAELLGHEPSAIERNEYYWEDEDEATLRSAEEKPRSLLEKALYFATAPPVIIGRATINVFHRLVPEDFERQEARSQTRSRTDYREPGRLSDTMISMIAGIALAMGVVFPALKYVVTEIFTTVAESKVRKLNGNLSISPDESEFDVIPLISEQILFPHYEAVEFDGTGGAELDDMENDGYPVISVER